jgi:hypothetical protein
VVAVRVGISKLEELISVVAEALTLGWKGERGWGYGHACRNMQVRGVCVGGG